MRTAAITLLLSAALGCGTAVWAEDAPATQTTKSDAAVAGDDAAKKPYKDEAVRHYNRGHDLHKQGFFNQAISEYKLALTADDRMEEAYTNLGLIFAAQRNYPKAMEAFKKSLAINPNRTNALNGLGTVLYARNKFAEAMEKWKLAVQIDPKFASAYFNMGNALENEKDFKGAVDAYASAIAIQPALADAYFRIGSIYAKQHHPAQSKLLLNRAIDLQPAGEFVREAKKTIAMLDAESAGDNSDLPEVKMNIMAPPSGTSTSGG